MSSVVASRGLSEPIADRFFAGEPIEVGPGVAKSPLR